MLESSSRSSSSKRSKNRTCEGLKMHCKQRSHLRAQAGTTVQIGRKELIISIAAEGNGGGLLRAVENSLKTGKPPGGWEERSFQGTDPDCSLLITITFVLSPKRSEEIKKEK